MSRNSAWIALVTALLFILPMASAENVNLISEDMIQTNKVNYDLYTAELGTYEQVYSNTGHEYFPHTYGVRPEVGGAKFVEYTVEKGQEVKKGDVLAIFSLETDAVRMTELQLQLEQAQAELEREMKLRAEEIEEMQEELRGIEDRFDYEIHALRIERAELELDQYVYQQTLKVSKTEEEIAELEALQEGAKLIAPVDGTVIRNTLKRAGDRVYTDETLVTLLRTEGRLLRFENSGLKFRYGMEVTVEVGTGKNKTQVPGRVVGSDLLVPEAQRDGIVYVEIDETDADMRTAKVRGNGSYLENVMIVPRKAVVLDGGKYYVTKLEDGITRKRYVNCIVKPGQQIWILQGVEVGEQIIVD